jgi:hypothetical protein
MTELKDPRLPDRFWRKVCEVESTGCWSWVAGHQKDGYGSYRLSGQSRLAHRVAYEALIGPVPQGLQIDHLCRNRTCVNPAHLEPVTARENTLRGVSIQAANARKTACPYGHQYTSRGGRRVCKPCDVIKTRRYRQKKRLQRAVTL